MTKQEAIEKMNMLDEALNFQRYDADECSQALQMAIEALEKQIPKKVKEDGYFGFNSYECPNCGHDANNFNYCSNCGQALKRQ